MSFAFDITSQTIISIHAPVKGATLRGGVFYAVTKYFNPRTREGCDDIEDTVVWDYYTFQSTHP